jgi:hypothetical protein
MRVKNIFSRSDADFKSNSTVSKAHKDKQERYFKSSKNVGWGLLWDPNTLKNLLMLSFRNADSQIYKIVFSF